MTDLNKEREVNLRFEHDDGAVWVFAGDSQFGTEISHLMMMHADEYSEDELRVICHHAACEIDKLRAELEKAKAQAVQQSFEIGRLQDRITELLDERQDLYAQINNDQAVPDTHIVVPRTREVVVAIEKIVQQQCDASGVQEPLHRLDGWRILEEIAEKVEEIK
ncbi:hypothetical protein [Acinetobacter pittii]|uniref:hypothetical protein n=1 Tax=Acinetobacter pittii TaxID=48296 RepID=UPI002813DE49|nr:hypothetical protein [Acinetobacter pittii]MDQ9995015.1 hypothetical protein [Acinetobacter pittii]